MRIRILIIIVALALAGCAKAPASLSPTGARLYQINQAVVAIGAVQHAAIELNNILICEPLPCHPLLSDTNTGIVVDNVASALMAVQTAPEGWRATLGETLAEIEQRLDQAGKSQLMAYVTTARTIVNALIGDGDAP